MEFSVVGEDLMSDNNELLLPKIKDCCTMMRKNIAFGNVGVGYEEVEMFGRPSFHNDGDGYFDDMTDQIPINFCPWCGTKIEIERKKE